MTSKELMPWSGEQFLGRVGGTAHEFSPARVLFLIHRVSASGRLWLTQGADIRTLDFVDGKVVGCSGFGDLLHELGVEGERLDSLNRWVERAVEGGHSRDQAMDAVGGELGRFIVGIEGNAELMIQFAPGSAPPTDPMPLPMSLTDMVAQGVARCGLVAETRARGLVENAEPVLVTRPDDSGTAEWGLSPACLAVLDSAERAGTLGEVGLDGDDAWETLALLRILGLVSIGAVAPPAMAAEPEPERVAPPPPRPAKPVAAPASGDGTGRFDRPHRSGSTPRRPRPDPVKKRKRKSRVEVLSKNPWESPADQVEADLRLAYDVLGASRPETSLMIRTPEELVTDTIEQRYRDACARYHPDRYLGSNQAVCALAEGCFGRVSDAYHKLKDPVQLEQARDRLVFKATGKRPVNDKTRARARVDFKRAEMLFRQRKYDEATKVAHRAEEGDPARWEYKLLYLRSAWRGGELQTAEVVERIVALEGMDSRERGEALYIAGEMQLKDGRQKEAFGLFKQAVSTDPENVGARRRLRLAENRKAKESKTGRTGAKGGAKKGGKPLFGGLFGRRGD